MIIGNSEGEGGFISKGCLVKSLFKTSWGEGVIKDPLEWKILGVGSANQRVFCVCVGGGGGMNIFWKHTFQIPRKTIFRFCAQRSWETICNNFLVPWKSMETHLLNVFNFLSQIFFLGTGSHKPNNTKLIDTKKCFSFVYKPHHN